MKGTCPGCNGVVGVDGIKTARFERMLEVHRSTCPGGKAKAAASPAPVTTDEMLEALGSALVIDKGQAPAR